MIGIPSALARCSQKTVSLKYCDRVTPSARGLPLSVTIPFSTM
ncbi:Uncharacterised protein [Mycobacteroides abscessus]|nr:Uncharacterised protein [Mycobacteroides abscessus]